MTDEQQWAFIKHALDDIAKPNESTYLTFLRVMHELKFRQMLEFEEMIERQEKLEEESE